MDQASKKQVSSWLLACYALLFAKVVTKGATCRTHSLLSMIEWHPMTGSFRSFMGKFAGTIALLVTPKLRWVNGTF